MRTKSVAGVSLDCWQNSGSPSRVIPHAHWSTAWLLISLEIVGTPNRRFSIYADGAHKSGLQLLEHPPA